MANVAVVLSDDFEDSEFRVPYDHLKAAGHNLTIIGKKDLAPTTLQELVAREPGGTSRR